MTAKALGASRKQEHKGLGTLGDWVTVWGVPVWHGPVQERVIAALKEQGHDVRIRGHHVQVRLDSEQVGQVDSIQEFIKTGGKA